MLCSYFLIPDFMMFVEDCLWMKFVLCVAHLLKVTGIYEPKYTSEITKCRPQWMGICKQCFADKVFPPNLNGV